MKKIYLQVKFGKNNKTKAYILDLSRFGMGIAAVSRLRKGLIVDIIPKIKLLPKLQAEVIYNSKIPRKSYNYRTGVKLINLNPKQRSCLDKFIKSCAKKVKNGN